MVNFGAGCLLVGGLTCLLSACGSDPAGATVDASAADAVISDRDAGQPDGSVTRVDAAVAPPDATAPLNTEGDDNQYVMDRLLIPTSSNAAASYGLNIDQDPAGRPDNALGQILTTLQSTGGLDMQGAIDTQIDRGEQINLINMRATDLSSASGVGVWVMPGENPSIAPCLSPSDTVCRRHLEGTAAFDVSADAGDGVVVGANAGSAFRGGPGEIMVKLGLFGGPPVVFTLRGARMEINSLSAATLTNAKLGGGIWEEDLTETVLPAIHQNIAATVSSDCFGTAPDCCNSGSGGATLVDLFDEDSDCVVTLDEVKNSALIASLLAPDVDLFDCPTNSSPLADCEFAPNQDGVDDCLSLGVGFTAVSGSFALPDFIANL